MSKEYLFWREVRKTIREECVIEAGINGGLSAGRYIESVSRKSSQRDVR